MPGLSFKHDSTDGYRFGFNGKEMLTNELSEIYLFEARVFNSQIVRWFSRDPLYRNYSWQSPYSYFLNSPISVVDFKGMGGDDRRKELIEHNVVSGDNLTKIAESYNTTVDRLLELNPEIKNPDLIYVGQVIKAEIEVEEMMMAVVKVPSLIPNGNTPLNPAYEQELAKRLSDGRVITMVRAISTLGNEFYDSPDDPTGILSLSEPEKQILFDYGSKKTLAILWMEFVEGTGRGTREFDISQPITQDIMDSKATQTLLANIKTWLADGTIVEGQQYTWTDFNSPDNSPFSHWFAQHMQLVNNAPAFFMGSLDFSFVVNGNSVEIVASNGYSISSGVTRNSEDDLTRITGYRCRLGNTVQKFNFTATLPE